MAEWRVRLFRNGRNQAIRIPRDLELPGKEAILRPENGRLILEAVPPSSLLVVLAGLEPLEEDLGPTDDPPPEPIAL